VTYSCGYNDGTGGNGQFWYQVKSRNVYFGGKLMRSAGVTVVTDRLGSVRANSNGERMSYFPYGEERTSTADGREKFGTYFRDPAANGGLDYADQRYYSNAGGSFLTPDPSGFAAANPKNPTSWNRYLYVLGDPINLTDPTGMNADECDPEMGDDCYEEGPDDCEYCVDGGVGGVPPTEPDSGDNQSEGAPGYCDSSTAATCITVSDASPQVALAPTPNIVTIAAQTLVNAVGTVVSAVIVGILLPTPTASCDTLECQGIMPGPDAGRKGERRRTAKPDKPRKHAWPDGDPKDPKTRWWVRDPQDPGKRILKPPGWRPDN